MEVIKIINSSYLKKLNYLTIGIHKLLSMKSNYKTLLLFLLFVLVNFSCTNKSSQANFTPSLASTFKEDFKIGAAINQQQILEQDSLTKVVIANQFNILTPENIMKSNFIHHMHHSFNFDIADKLIALARKNQQ
jgi:endo-1,4-beta-xylanase